MIRISDPWAAYQFDSAVIYFGNAISAAIQERVEVGEGQAREYRPKYEFSSLLEPGTTLEKPPSKADKERAGVEAFQKMLGIQTDRINNG